MLIDEKRGLEEEYTSAGNTSDLRVQADVRSDADILIAAGMSASRVGMALLRLHGEWDKAEKPRKPTPAQVAALQSVQPKFIHIRVDGTKDEFRVKHLSDKERYEMARIEAQGWYMGEMAKLVNKLKSLPTVRKQLTEYVPKWGIAEAAVKVPAVIAYWLDQTCHACHGLKYQRMPGTPSLSSRACKVCAGAGVAPVPHGQEGRRVANYMDDCVSRAQHSLRARLRFFRDPA